MDDDVHADGPSGVGPSGVAPSGVALNDAVFVEWAGTFRVQAIIETASAGEDGSRLGLHFSPQDPDKPTITPPAVGQGVRVRMDGGTTSWTGVVVDVGEANLTLEVHGEDTAQRAFFRMPVRLRIVFRHHDSQLQVMGNVVELSGGGCCVSVPPGSIGKGEVRKGYLQLDDQKDSLLVRLEALRVRRDGDHDTVACRFIEIKEPDRQRILRRLFDEYRRIRRGGRSESA